MTEVPSWRAIWFASLLIREQHGPKPTDLPPGCRQCGYDGCPLLRWAELVLAGEWPAYPALVG